MPKDKSARRSLPLDVLRSAAIFLVMLKHAYPLVVETGGLADHVIERFHFGGWIGVDLFFVLSGFLVSGLLFGEYKKHGDVRVGRFLIRRGLKIYPAFYFFIAYTIFVHLPGYPLSGLVAELLFVQNYAYGLWGHTWSLAVEEHFYLFIALVVYVRGRQTPDGSQPFDIIPRLFVLLAASMLTARILNSAFFEYTLRTHHFPTLVRMDSLMFGTLVSYYYHFFRDSFIEYCRRYRALLAVTGILLLLPAFFFRLWATPLLTTVGLCGIYLGSGMLLASCIVGPFPRNLVTVTLGAIGTYSYSIYLWHVATRDVVARLAREYGDPLSPGLLVLAYLAASLAVGIFTAIVVEIPVLRLRDRFFPSRSLLVMSQQDDRPSSSRPAAPGRENR